MSYQKYLNIYIYTYRTYRYKQDLAYQAMVCGFDVWTQEIPAARRARRVPSPEGDASTSNNVW